jgi:hypothetical protein
MDSPGADVNTQEKTKGWPPPPGYYSIDEEIARDREEQKRGGEGLGPPLPPPDYQFVGKISVERQREMLRDWEQAEAESKAEEAHRSTAGGNNQVFQVSGSPCEGKTGRGHNGAVTPRPVWGVPVLVPRKRAIPAFPLASLPPSIQGWAEAVSENSQTPVDLAAIMGLVATSIAVAKKVEVQPVLDNPEYIEPAVIWGCVPLPPGERKTFVVEQAKLPFELHLSEWGNKNGASVEFARQQLSALVKRKAHLIDKLAKAKPEEQKELEKQLREAVGKVYELESSGSTVAPRFLTDDVTPERLAVLMSKHGGRIGILTDEGGCFDHFAGIYNKQPNLDVYLHGHSGGTIRRDRQKDGEEIYVPKAALTIGVSPQPQVISGMNSKGRLLGRGLLARFSWALPESNLGNRNWKPKAIPEKVKKRYVKKITDLINWCPGGVRRVTLSKRAYGIWIDKAEEIEKELGNDGKLSSYGIQSWAAKLPGLIARYALLLHAILANGEDTISRETMAHAANIGIYLVRHAIGAFRLIRLDGATEDAYRLQAWIINKAREGKSVFGRSQAQLSHKGRFPAVSDIDPALAILTDRQVCRPRPTEPVGPGRPPVWYEINPALRETREGDA